MRFLMYSSYVGSAAGGGATILPGEPGSGCVSWKLASASGSSAGWPRIVQLVKSSIRSSDGWRARRAARNALRSG